MLIIRSLSIRTARERSLLHSQTVRLTHRLSMAERERRMQFVCNKIVDMLMMGRGFLSEELLRDWVKTHPGVVFRRGKVRVLGIQAVTIPMSKYFKEDWDEFGQMFSVWWDLMIRMKMFKRSLQLCRQMFGANIFDGARPQPMHKWYLNAASWLSFGKPFHRLSKNKQSAARTLSHAEGLAQFFRKGMMAIMGKKWIEDLKAVRSQLYMVKLHHTAPLENIRILSKVFPHHLLTVFGAKELTRRQTSRLAFRKQKMQHIIFWDLMFNMPVIQNELGICSWLKIVVKFSFFGITAYAPFTQWNAKEESSRRFIIPASVADNLGIPYKPNPWLNPGKMVVPIQNTYIWSGALKAKVARLRKSVGFYDNL